MMTVRSCDIQFCTGRDSWMDKKKLHDVQEHLDVVIDWALEKVTVHPHIVVEVAPCGENDLQHRLLVRPQRCVLSPTQVPRKGDTVCTRCWKAADECLHKAATAVIRQQAVVIYQHAAVGDHGKVAEFRRDLARKFDERVR